MEIKTPEKSNIMKSEEGKLILFDYLYKKFEICGNKDFTFVIKNVARILNFSSQRVSISLKDFKENDFVVLLEPRSKRCLWKTNFAGKTKEEVENAIV